MISLFKSEPWSLESLSPPWGQLDSIFVQIRKGVTEPLPDESLVFPLNKLKWVGGAMDGIMGGPAEGRNTEKRIFTFVAAVQTLQQRASDEALKNLYELVTEGDLVGCIDRVLQELSKYPSTAAGRFLQIGRYLAVRAAHREAVKFGLALVGAFGTAQDLEIPATLGLHDEFTLFAMVAIGRLSSDPEADLWNLAKKVKGWGRVQIVRRLCDTQNPEIQAWMLREGFRNEVMDEYLACICARAGRLHEALNQQFVDRELLDATADIIRALINGGPAEDMDDYEHSADVCEAYLNIVWSRNDLDLDTSSPSLD